MIILLPSLGCQSEGILRKLFPPSPYPGQGGHKANNVSWINRPNFKLIAYANAPGLSDVSWYIGQQGQVPRPFYGQGQGTLMLSTGTGFTPRRNLPPIRYILAQLSRVFVIYHLDIIDTKRTKLTPRYIPRPTLPSAPRFVRVPSSHFCLSYLKPF